MGPVERGLPQPWPAAAYGLPAEDWARTPFPKHVRSGACLPREGGARLFAPGALARGAQGTREDATAGGRARAPPFEGGDGQSTPPSAAPVSHGGPSPPYATLYATLRWHALPKTQPLHRTQRPPEQNTPHRCTQCTPTPCACRQCQTSLTQEDYSNHHHPGPEGLLPFSKPQRGRGSIAHWCTKPYRCTLESELFLWTKCTAHNQRGAPPPQRKGYDCTK